MILGAVIEAASAERYEDYMSEQVLAPLGMMRSRFYYEDAFAPGTQHAVGSHPDDFMAFIASFTLDLGQLSRECTHQRYWFEYFSPDQTPPSGIISTSPDMVRFGRMILGRGMLDGTRVLSEDSVERMTKAHVGVYSSPMGPLVDYAFGDSWFITNDDQGRSVLLHGGQGMAFTSLLMIRAEDELVAALAANGTYVDGAKGMNLMEVLRQMDWEDPKPGVESP